VPEPTTANFLVYRDGRQRVGGDAVVRQLACALMAVGEHFSDEGVISALLCAGVLECALCDAASEHADSAGKITDHLAEFVCTADLRSHSSCSSIGDCLRLLSRIAPRGELSVSRPEGFAYYALHPLDFADVISSVRLSAPCAVVIGIRSIGTTLSASAAAKLRSMDIATSRTTVRPAGHPYDRRTTLNQAQRDLVKHGLSQDATFIVCDEGPGRSGSSLLSVAEALEAEGVGPGRILLLCSNQPNPDALCAPRAAERWQHYRSIASAQTKRLPAEAGRYLGGGEWRTVFVPEDRPWPATWPQTERLKFLSRDGRRVFKFEGHGCYGEQVRRREEMLSASEFGRPYLGREAGFGIHEVVNGIPAQSGDISPALLRHFARYCAWRSASFPAAASEDGLPQLETMASINCEQELGFAPELHLEIEHPVVCDGRMQPHEWIAAGGGRWIKLDASTHGDDHFFPGPTDIAWDLAGLCVEWELNAECRNFLFEEYSRLSGDRPHTRLTGYELAYAAFRLGWSRMAAASVAGSFDEHLLLQDAERYRRALVRLAEFAPVLG